MTDSGIVINRVESQSEQSTLEELLLEFHEWLAGYAESYEPDTELAADRRSLNRHGESHAWIAREAGEPAGCVILLGPTDELAEMKRLWVRPAHRGAGIGRMLSERVVESARNSGYETVGLTTPPWSDAAHELYESMGFERTPPYPETKLPEKYHEDAIFMQLDLRGNH